MHANKINITLLFLFLAALTKSWSQTDSIFNEDSVDILVPVFTTTVDLLENESQSQDISGLLQSSRDVYVNQAGFNFSAARFRLRGYSSENTRIFFNGIPVNDPENGWTIWSYWGGLNDITRNLVGVSKIALSTLLITGIWYPSLVCVSAILMGGFMFSAQCFHFKIKNTFIKHLPSLIFLGLCIFIALQSCQ